MRPLAPQAASSPDALIRAAVQDATVALPDTGRCVAAQFDAEGVWVYCAGEAAPAGPVRAMHLSTHWPDFTASLEGRTDRASARALKLRRPAFEDLLRQAVDAAYDPERYPVRQAWRLAIRFARVTLRWHASPEAPLRHTPRLCLRGDLVARLVDDWSLLEVDVEGLLSDVDRAPLERVYPVSDPAARERLLGSDA